VLIDESRSVFTIDDFPESGQRKRSRSARIKRAIDELLPTGSKNQAADRTLAQFASLLRPASAKPVVLVVGGRVLGEGMDILVDPGIDLIESDIAIGPRTALIADGHCLPFGDHSVDGVVVQAVLEHVVDPVECVAEIYRVLKPDGYVYAETPFMQQTHGAPYDFTRFTRRGHRRLFRRFTEIDSGAAGGPGMALAWSYRYFLLSLSRSKRVRTGLDAFARTTSFFLPHLDRRILRNPRSLDAASGFYFIGQKSEQVLPDRELMRLYPASE
jgi:SAM-dependent methyltransferase